MAVDSDCAGPGVPLYERRPKSDIAHIAQWVKKGRRMHRQLGRALGGR